MMMMMMSQKEKNKRKKIFEIDFDSIAMLYCTNDLQHTYSNVRKVVVVE